MMRTRTRVELQCVTLIDRETQHLRERERERERERDGERERERENERERERDWETGKERDGAVNVFTNSADRLCITHLTYSSVVILGVCSVM